MISSIKIKTIIFSISGAILLILIVVGLFAYFFLFDAPQTNADPERFIVSLEEPKQDAINKLYEQGFVKNKWAFGYALKGRGIKPGGYKISKSMTAWQMAETFKEPYMKWVVIPEGLRKEQIVELIGEALGWDQETKKKWVSDYTAMNYDEIEGVYFPDTYLLPKDETGLQIADRLRVKFNEVSEPYYKESLKQNIRWKTLLKIASIIQREAAGKEDMPLIAGVLWNRLLNNPPMKLEIDATIQYIRDSVIHYGEVPHSTQLANYSSEGDWWKPITTEDIKIESPYNTYLNQGLPPHPICNPGVEAIKAVLNPAETECFFYLHDETGQIHCAKTYEEHQTNIEKYLK